MKKRKKKKNTHIQNPEIYSLSSGKEKAGYFLKAKGFSRRTKETKHWSSIVEFDACRYTFLNLDAFRLFWVHSVHLGLQLFWKKIITPLSTVMVILQHS